jgi:hypothetical protein
METPPAPEAQLDNSGWIYAVIGVLIAALVVAAILLLSGDEKNKTDRGPSRGAGIKQAQWKVLVQTVRGPALPEKGAKPSKHDARQLSRVIRTVYEAIYLRPQLMGKTSKRYMTKATARAVKKGARHIPNKARRIKTLRRVAVIGYDSGTRSRAAAEVTVVATGKNKGKRFRAVTHDRLWLERSHRRWRIIAFNVNLEPLPLKSPDGKKDGKEDGSKPDKKGGSKAGEKAGKKANKKDGGRKKDGRKDSKK